MYACRLSVDQGGVTSYIAKDENEEVKLVDVDDMYVGLTIIGCHVACVHYIYPYDAHLHTVCVRAHTHTHTRTCTMHVPTEFAHFICDGHVTVYMYLYVANC